MGILFFLLLHTFEIFSLIKGFKKEKAPEGRNFSLFLSVLHPQYLEPSTWHIIHIKKYLWIEWAWFFKISVTEKITILSKELRNRSCLCITCTHSKMGNIHASLKLYQVVFPTAAYKTNIVSSLFTVKPSLLNSILIRSWKTVRPTEAHTHTHPTFVGREQFAPCQQRIKWLTKQKEPLTDQLAGTESWESLLCDKNSIDNEMVLTFLI